MVRRTDVRERATYDAEEVARLAGVHRVTVYEGARDGTVPGAIRLGRRLLFSRAAIDAWLGAGTAK